MEFIANVQGLTAIAIGIIIGLGARFREAAGWIRSHPAAFLDEPRIVWGHGASVLILYPASQL